jgi:hypothetical protein
MRKRISLLVAALIMALTMSFGSVAAFAKVNTTESNPPGGGGGQTCTITTGNGGGGGTFKGEEKGSCNSANAPTFPK